MLTDMPSRWWSFLAAPAKVDASTGDAIVRCEQSTASAGEVSRFATRIHQRPLARYDSVGLGGVHAWAFVKATAPGASLSAAIPLVLSILLMGGQSAIMYAVAYEAAHPRCSRPLDAHRRGWMAAAVLGGRRARVLRRAATAAGGRCAATAAPSASSRSTRSASAFIMEARV